MTPVQRHPEIPAPVATRLMNELARLKHREGRLTLQWSDEAAALYCGREKLGSGPTLAEALADALKA